MHSSSLASVRLFMFVLWTGIVVPSYLMLLLAGHGYRAVAGVYWRGCLRVLGMTVRTRGTLTDERPLICVVNHASYLDIVALGALIPGAFVAKVEVRTWPFIGALARMGRTVFVDRRPIRVAGQRDEMIERLKSDEPLILFPEGTSNDGNRVLLFKSSLFSIAEKDIAGRMVTIQPVTIAYTRVNGIPIGYAWRPFFAWYGNMELMPHLWHVLGLGQVTIEVEFHPAQNIVDHPSRKELARACHEAVASGLSRALAGREP
ncbi:MAG: 1-acyl-sn-glycerol-3-phosphate acyltransferase [Alphaproteobacteria bacterium]|nr:1-acyl-sn-glycerol-3-phosphate acyltransferase [Alphaproteobacteria bacterium]